MESFNEILIEITGGSSPLTSIKEVAHIMGVHEQTAYGYRNGTSEPNWRDVVRLSQYLIREHKYYKLAMQPVLSCSSNQANGEVSDELLLLFESATDLNRAFSSSNKTQFWSAWNKIEAVTKALKNEGEALK